MLLSLDHNFLFIHVPKTAGLSLTAALSPYALPRNRTPLRRVLSWLPVRENPAKAYFRYHVTADQLRRKLHPDLFEKLHKFAVVRNPYDYAVSYYSYTRNNPTSRRYEEAQNWSFADFLDYFERKDRWMPRSQSAWLTDSAGRFLVDRVMFVERLEQDFADLTAHLGLPGLSLPHTNRSPRKDYRGYYTPDLKRQVERIYADDFTHFGYDFEQGLPTRSSLG